eukprot:g3345.t1
MKLSNFTPKKLGVAVSGGRDSIAACLAIQRWALSVGKEAPELHAFTVDHDLRRESASEVDSVHRWLDPRGFQCASRKINWKKLGGRPSRNKLHSIARDERRQLLLEMCKEAEVSHLILAHHADDQVETFLQRMVKSSGLDGLRSMDSSTILLGTETACLETGIFHSQNILENEFSWHVHLLRPFLTVSKDRLHVILDEEKQEWAEDESNTNLNFDRPRIRAFRQSLRKRRGTKEFCTEDAIAFINRIKKHSYRRDQAVASLLSKSVLTNNKLGFSLLHVPSFFETTSHSNFIREHALSSLIRFHGGRKYPPPGRFLRTLCSEIKYSSNGEPLTLMRTIGGCGVVFQPWGRNGSVLLLCREPLRKNHSMKQAKISQLFSSKKGLWSTIWDRRFLITAKKERCGELGRSKQLVVQQLSRELWEGLVEKMPEFKKKKKNLPMTVRLSLPVICEKNEDEWQELSASMVVYVPYLDWTRSDFKTAGYTFTSQPIQTMQRDNEDNLTESASNAFKIFSKNIN